MANYGGQNYTTFSAVNLKGSVALRVAGSASGLEGTVSAKSDDEGLRAWQFPAKSGTFPIMGTFRVQIATQAGAAHSTIVTVTGIRAEDALVVQFNGAGVSGTTYGFAQSTGHIIVQAVPGNGNITLYMNNPGNSTAYVDLSASYLAMR